MDYTAKIRELNDAFRKNPLSRRGELFITRGVFNLGQQAFAEIMCSVQEFDIFTAENDPHDEHDFGSFTHDGHKIFWKIDYYSDTEKKWGSEAPHDGSRTHRVLTVMLAEEY